MDKNQLLSLQKTRTVLLEEDGWKIIFRFNHFKETFWYEIEDPTGRTLNFNTKQIYIAINKVNELSGKVVEG